MQDIRKKQEAPPQTTTSLCVRCQEFFGNPEMGNMCSSCYKITTQQTPSTSSNQPIPQQQYVEEEKQIAKPIQTETNKCWICKKRIGLTGIKCRCGYVFCSQHRYAQEHNCSIDYEKIGKEKLKKENPLVQHNKLEKS